MNQKIAKKYLHNIFVLLPLAIGLITFVFIDHLISSARGKPSMFDDLGEDDIYYGNDDRWY